MELWGRASKSNILIMQRSQSNILRMIVDAPWYVSNATLHADLGISYVQDAIHQKCNKYHATLETHESPLLKALLILIADSNCKFSFYNSFISNQNYLDSIS
jgi:hypothetical protein